MEGPSTWGLTGRASKRPGPSSTTGPPWGTLVCVVERATYERRYLYSDGIAHVLVNGVVVLREAELVEDVSPGKWMGHETAGGTP